MGLSRERLHAVLEYDPASGNFLWLVSTSNRVRCGRIAGGLTGAGYRLIAIDGKKYLAHHLAIFYMTGAWPLDQVDHRNLCPDDNSWTNLREATAAQNSTNKRTRCDSRSGLKGVGFHAQTGKWRACIRKHGRIISLGLFSDPLSAHAAYAQAAKTIHGEFARVA